jgi:NOL1/NOP2/fmu family ribosome biogenesis protein
MALSPGQECRSLDLDREDGRVLRYLQGHPIESSGEAGWVVVRVDGFALGWGKRVGPIVKNHYPKGLRWRG